MFPRHDRRDGYAASTTLSSARVEERFFSQRHPRVRLMVFVGLLAVSASLLRFAWVPTSETLESLGYIGLFGLGLLASSTIIFPGVSLLLVLPAGAAFDPLAVGLSVGAGASLGELTGYALGRTTNPHIPSRHIFLSRVQRFVRAHRTLGVFLLATLPGPQFDIGGAIAGATRMPIASFLITTFFGKVIRFYILASLGARSFSTALPSSLGGNPL